MMSSSITVYCYPYVIHWVKFDLLRWSFEPEERKAESDNAGAQIANSCLKKLDMEPLGIRLYGFIFLAS